MKQVVAVDKDSIMFATSPRQHMMHRASVTMEIVIDFSMAMAMATPMVVAIHTTTTRTISLLIGYALSFTSHPARTLADLALL